jgi:hypothetical protein
MDWQATYRDLATPKLRAMLAAMDASAARAQIEAGVTATDPTGRRVTFGPQTLEHWRGYADESVRPGFLPAALRAVQAPVERWTKATQDVWVAAFARPQGGYRGVVVAQPGGEAIAYFLRSLTALDAARKGVAVWRAAP